MPATWCLLILFPYLASPLPLSSLVATNLFSVSVSLSLFYLFIYFLDSVYKGKHGVSFSISPSIISSMLLQMATFLSYD